MVSGGKRKIWRGEQKKREDVGERRRDVVQSVRRTKVRKGRIIYK